MLNLWNRCEPKSHTQSGIRESLKMPTNLREISHHQKKSGICASPKNTHKSEIRVNQAAHAQPRPQSRIRVKKKAPRMGGYHFLRSLSLKKTIAISYDSLVLMMNTKAAAITR